MRLLANIFGFEREWACRINDRAGVHAIGKLVHVHLDNGRSLGHVNGQTGLLAVQLPIGSDLDQPELASRERWSEREYGVRCGCLTRNAGVGELLALQRWRSNEVSQSRLYLVDRLAFITESSSRGPHP